MRHPILLAAVMAALAGVPTAAQQGLSPGFNQEGTENNPDGTAVPESGVELPEDIETDTGPMARAPKALLRGLDTLTNTVNDFEIRAGETLAFRRLIVTLEACYYPPSDPLGEAYAFLRIRDNRETDDRFSGWMLASSPALSALDHPRYDIWVLSCSTD